MSVSAGDSGWIDYIPLSGDALVYAYRFRQVFFMQSPRLLE